MMDFQTKVPIDRQMPAITYDAKTVLLGSCFVTHIGAKMGYYQFQNLVNPFGIIFNPYSIALLVERAINKRLFTADDLFFANGRWHGYELHSDCSRTDRDIAIKSANKGVLKLRKDITEASHLVITLGTSWVYSLKESGSVVANCHKQPQVLFEKTLLDVATVRAQLEKIDALVKSVNPDCAIIATVSPVRHLRDGMVENQRSKAHLLTALHEVIDTTAKWHYFPSYEILMDELRDYRFYADDMLHPSNVAINVVWERFSNAWIAEDAFDVMKRVERVRRAQQHKPFDPDGEAHRNFLKKLEEDINALTTEFPHMEF
ncbi:GSCFA domain-containing protein [Robertkochia sediminum]|uniref:GSCFA domain-containing protein n=1 Tax=Robertkochia sediminum TaxID=2785326 RepID=UPI001933B3BC|nr:GSCFA domain-containing protein [Robertkochia sediminum]MBL7472893.1 GSCFA domain-containing protein [Robertkochia sediminum]